ncbi:DUF4249 family protein [candidate division WOR-3 bacterium]|nr:DUF4249 family protein [candidate division WOR-3 bacterium]
MKRILFSPLVFLLTLGCSGVQEPEFEPETNVLALMRIDNRPEHIYPWQLIYVDQSYDIQDTVNVLGVRGARVEITGGEDVYTFVDSFYNEDSLRWEKYAEGHYYDWPHPKLNDTTLYRLQVIYPDGDTVTGEAYMPSAIEISYPEDSQAISISQQVTNPLTITWNSCKNTLYYMIICKPDVDTSEYDSYPPFLFMPAIRGDTSYAYFQERMILPWVYDMYYVLRVVALSPEYADYFGLEGPGSDMGNLSGGYGMFGGISEDSIRVYIVP